MIVCLPGCVCDHGYRYGYNAMGMGTSPACQEVTGMGSRPSMGTGSNFGSG